MNLDEGTTAEKRRGRVRAVALPVVAVLVVVAGGFMVFAGGGGSQGASTAVVASPEPTATPDHGHSHDHDAGGAAPAEAWSTLAAFLDAWRDTDQQTRAAGLVDTATPRLAEGLVLTSEAKTVTAAVTAVTVESVTPYTVEFHVDLAGVDGVRVVAVGDPDARQGWLVDHVAPIEEG